MGWRQDLNRAATDATKGTCPVPSMAEGVTLLRCGATRVDMEAPGFPTRLTGTRGAICNTSRRLFAQARALIPRVRTPCTISLQAVSFSHLLPTRILLAGGRRNGAGVKLRPGAPVGNSYIPFSHLMGFYSVAVKGLNDGN